MSDEYVVTVMFEGLATTIGTVVLGWLSQKLIGVSLTADPSKSLDSYLKMLVSMGASMTYAQWAMDKAEKEKVYIIRPSPL